jgi:hypothetical protein
MADGNIENAQGAPGEHHASVHLPAPTVWPLVLALGIALITTGMVTHWGVALLGLILVLPAIVGWFRSVLPSDRTIDVAVTSEIVPAFSSRTALPHLLPVETFNVMAGVKGGIAGGIAMIVPAALYGLIRYHSIWYAANLLAAGGFVSWAGQSNAFLAEFHLQGLLAAFAIHATASVLIGLLYGAMLPMYPKKPILTAGFIAPFLWTGLLYSALGIISPILNQRINWAWFVVSQIFFGLVAGFVVNLQIKVRTPQFQELPFAIRAGIHTSAKDKGGRA